MTPELLVKLYYTYRMPGRFYHNADHIAECFREFISVKHLVNDEHAMRWAIWFHDCVYDPKQNDYENVRRSAEEAIAAAKEEGLDEATLKAVSDLIMVTTHDHPPVTNDEKIMCDIDLVSLASDNFAERSEQIRKEYSHVTDEAFYPARKAILRKFLEREHIYCTEFFRQKYEEKARANLLEAIA
jgi:predicted metal-dependent HD superfamily phosphohydrolase